MPPDDHEAIRAVKAEIGRELMGKYGAHGLGIARLVKNGVETDELALTFYVEPGAESAESIPSMIEYCPKGTRAVIRVPTQVLIRPRASRG